jgi:hypothetical protein
MILLANKKLSIAFIYSVIFVLFYILINDTFYAEANYFTYRIELMTNQYRPYTDFEYAYGPSFLYIPFLISSIFKISVEFSYIFSYFIFTFISVLMLQYISIKILKDGYFIFVLTILAIYFNLSLGLNYNLIRFITAYYLIIKLCEFSDIKSFSQFLFWQSLFLLVTYSISPEVFMVYLVVSFLTQVFLYRKKTNEKVLFFSISVIIFILLFQLEPRYFNTFINFGKSASNFQFEFTKIFSIGVLIFMLFIVNTFMIINRKTYIDNKTIMSIYITSICFIPAIYSHGVFDWVTALNSFGIFLLFYYFFQIKTHIFLVLLAIGLLLFRIVEELNFYQTSISSRIIKNISYSHALVEINAIQKIFNNTLPIKKYFKKLDAETEVISYIKNSRLKNISMPFTYSKKNILTALLNDKIYKNTYYSGLVNIKTLDQKYKKIQLILDSSYILIEDFQLDLLNIYNVEEFFELEKIFDGYYLFKQVKNWGCDVKGCKWDMFKKNNMQISF